MFYTLEFKHVKKITREIVFFGRIIFSPLIYNSKIWGMLDRLL